MLKDTINSAIDNFKKCPHDMSQMGDFYFQNLILSSDIVQRNIMKQLLPKDETVLSEGDNNKFHDKQNDLIMQVKLKLMNNSVDTTNNNYSNQAIHNLDLRNKIDLCKGILANISIQEKLKYLKMPIIYVYSKKNCFIPLKHSDIIQKSSQKNDQDIPQSSYQYHPDTQQFNLTYNPMDKILSDNLQRTTFLIDGAHDVFQENLLSTERIIKDYCEVKTPMKYFLMTSLKGALKSNFQFQGNAY